MSQALGRAERKARVKNIRKEQNVMEILWQARGVGRSGGRLPSPDSPKWPWDSPCCRSGYPPFPARPCWRWSYGTDPVSRGCTYLAGFAPRLACHFGHNRTMLSFPDWRADADSRIALITGLCGSLAEWGPPFFVFVLSGQNGKRETDHGQGVVCRLGAPRLLAASLQSIGRAVGQTRRSHSSWCCLSS